MKKNTVYVLLSREGDRGPWNLTNIQTGLEHMMAGCFYEKEDCVAHLKEHKEIFEPEGFTFKMKRVSLDEFFDMFRAAHEYAHKTEKELNKLLKGV